jgi:L-alanine-DL-glutamate epimerase-like enolase superfamily enzyme
MQVTGVSMYAFEYTRLRPVSMSGGRDLGKADSTLIRLTTDDGLDGWGEVCPLGAAYMQSFIGGARAAIAEMAPSLIGADPRQLDRFYGLMDGALKGHSYAKSAIDIAAWDLAGKAAGVPVSHLLGGVYRERFPLYCTVSLASPAAMADSVRERAQAGYRRFQLKVGDDWREDVRRVNACADAARDSEMLIADANAGWSQPDAVHFAAAFGGSGIYIEQPCEDLETCAEVRRRSVCPFILDESMNSIEALFRARALQAFDGAVLKLSRLGGITRVRIARELMAEWGLRCTIEDAGGGDIVAAAMAHCTASTRPANFLNGWLTNVNVKEHVALDPPSHQDGYGFLPSGPGLGIDVDVERLGAPIFEHGASHP